MDPRITVGLLTDATGSPVQVHLFEGNKAETKTLTPVMTAFGEPHAVRDIVVVADAGTLSAADPLALEDAGFSFIVGSRTSKAPYDLAEHSRTKGNVFTQGQCLETTRTMGTGKAARPRRVVHQHKFGRSHHDNRAINARAARAERVADGARPMKKDRFVKIEDAAKGVDRDLVERAAGHRRVPRPLSGRAILPDD